MINKIYDFKSQKYRNERKTVLFTLFDIIRAAARCASFSYVLKRFEQGHDKNGHRHSVLPIVSNW